MAKYPPGIPYIIGNEAAERFSYYGMKTILVVFMTSYLRSRNGELQTMSPTEATAWFHLFSSANYLFPLAGALVADIFWGKYKTIIWLSLVYCLGHLALALDETRVGLTIGLTLIAIGAGGIKPCVASHVGDQFTKNSASLLQHAYDYFYIAVNLGAAVSSLLTPWLLEHYGPHLAFGVPGLLMLFATIVFRMGRAHFVALPPVGLKVFKREVSSASGKAAFKSLAIIFFYIAFFWALLDQTGSSWVIQSEKMDRHVDLSFGLLPEYCRVELLGSQIQALNPLLILLFVPLFSKCVYPMLARVVSFGAIARIAVGMVLSGTAFAVVGLAEVQLESGAQVSILWQALAYLILTAGEVMVSVTSLGLAYTQSPPALKSLLGSFYLLSVALGNALTSLVNFSILNSDGSSRISGSSYFFFFAIMATIAGSLFMRHLRGHRTYEYIRDEGQLEIV